MASAERVLHALKLARSVLDEIRAEPGAPHSIELQWRIAALRERATLLSDLVTAKSPLPDMPNLDLAIETLLAAVGRLAPPNIERTPSSVRSLQTENLGNALDKLETALGDPTTDPND